jgi:hypothetical protein
MSRHVPVEIIKRVVSRHFRLSKGRIDGPQRSFDVVKARHIAIALTRELTSLSTISIGKRFGNRDHTTVMNAITRANALHRKQMDMLLEQILWEVERQDRLADSVCPNLLFWLMLMAATKSEKPAVPVIAIQEPSKPVFVPRKVYPARIIAPPPRSANVTASLMGDPIKRGVSAREYRKETSRGI